MRRQWATMLVAVPVLLSGCVGSARTTDDYRRKAKTTATDVLSTVRTVRLAIDLERRGKTTHNYLSVLINDAERDASSIQSTFESIQPPNDTADAVRAVIDQVVSDAVSQLADARIAVRRDDREALLKLTGPLDESANKLEQLSGQE